jgi:PAS domain S-box-containing protein
MPSSIDGKQPVSDPHSGNQSVSATRHLGLLIDAIADHAIYMLDPEGFVTTWNTGAERIHGYRAIEIVGQHFSRLFIPEDRASRRPEQMLTVAKATGLYEAEGWCLRKDGRRFWANVIVQPIREESGALIGFAKITRDITERVAAQAALLDSERRFHMLVDAVTDYAIYMLDPSGLVNNWNTGAERLKGYTADEIIGQHFSRFYTKEDRASGLPGRVLDQAIREGRFEGEGWRVRKDGSRFWASVVVHAIRNPNGELEGFAKVTRDITERRAAHDTLRESERQFRLLVSNVTDYALYMLDPNGIITSWNAGAERIKGYTADEIIGQHFSRFYTERDRAAGMPMRALFTAATEGHFEAEGWRVRKDGNLFWANVVLQPIRDENGDLIGFAKITRDITERQEAQKALQEAQAQRAHAQKMDALGHLTGGVAHDFNNLLMVVSVHVQTILKNVGDDPKLMRAARAIELAGQRGAALTRQLLTFSRRQTSNPVVVTLAERIEAFRVMLSSSIGEAVRLITTITPDLWTVKVDVNELELALVNIVLNARDAMRNGGTISITAENVALSRRDTAARIEGDFVALRISDTGCGIAPDVLAKVFDPFFTTKEPNKGSGLGLSQVYGFAHQSGGTVTIASELGRGTTITLYLPRTHEAAGDEQRDGATEIAGAGRVLVVEDNPEVCGVTISMLEQLGYEVDAVASADAALEAIAARDFDLVLSDIVMAGSMNGLGLARALRDRKPALPVLLVTGFSEAVSAAPAEFTVMQKPFALAELSRTVARMIAGAKQSSATNVIRLRAPRAAPPADKQKD